MSGHRADSADAPKSGEEPGLRGAQPEAATAPTKAQQAWFNTKYTSDTYRLLFNLLRFNLRSREEIAQVIKSKMYDPVQRRDAEFAKTPDTERQLLLELATIEVLSNVVMALEDLGRVLS